MSIKHDIKDAARDVRDATKETIHRANADAEHETRDELGDQMTMKEKAESMGREGKERLEAEGDKLKRNVRDNT